MDGLWIFSKLFEKNYGAIPAKQFRTETHDRVTHYSKYRIQKYQNKNETKEQQMFPNEQSYKYTMCTINTVAIQNIL